MKSKGAYILASHSQNKTKLIYDFEEMQLLYRKTNRIRFTTKGDPPYRYYIDMEIDSVVLNGWKSLKYDCNLKFSLKLPNGYPGVPPFFEVLKGAQIPFHPHFFCPPVFGSLGFFISYIKKACWVDYDNHNPDEGLGAFVLRIARSLQYDPNYINANPPSSKIGNSKALNWYQKQLEKNPDMFPIDKVPLPEIDDGQIMKKPMDSPALKANEAASKEESAGSLQSTKKKFDITKKYPPYQPTAKSESEFEIEILSESLYKPPLFFKVAHKLYIDQPAATKIMNYIDWGKNTSVNRVEQGGLLLGHVYVDHDKGITYGMVEEVTAGNSARGTESNLEMNFETWKEMFDRADQSSAPIGKYKSQVIGWFHTHPGDLKVFMSDEDMRTQRRFFNKDWQFAIVLNPHKKCWRAYFGKNALECKGYVARNRLMNIQ